MLEVLRSLGKPEFEISEDGTNIASAVRTQREKVTQEFVKRTTLLLRLFDFGTLD